MANIAEFNQIKERYLEVSNETTFHTEASFAIQQINRNGLLQKCSNQSIMQAVYNTALTGLTLNPISQLAYLIPRYSNQIKGYEAQLMPSYQGLVKLLTDTGNIKKVIAHCVYEGDDFEIELGFDEKITHKPKHESKTLKGVYAIADFGDKRQIEYMTAEEIYEVRGSSDSYKAFQAKKVKSCVWIDWEPEMARKTVIKRLAKYLPKTESWDKVYKAISSDNEDYILDEFSDQVSYIHRLIPTSTLDEQELQLIESEALKGLTSHRAGQIINKLLLHQTDPIKDRGNCSSQKNIHKALDDVMNDERK